MNQRAHAAAKEMDPVIPNWKISYRIPEAAAATGYGESTLWKRISEGRLKAKKDGNFTVIEADELRRFVRDLPDAKVPGTLP
jgi:hypothetical protein